MTSKVIINTYRISSIILIVLGIIHCVMVFVNFEILTSEALFSIGTGIAVLFLGLINYTAAKILNPFLLTIASRANFIQVVYGVLSITILKDIPSIFGCFIFLLVLILSWLVKKRLVNNK